VPPSPAPPPNALARSLYGLPNVAWLKAGNASSRDPAYGGGDVTRALATPLQYESSVVLTSSPYYAAQCGSRAALFSSSGSEQYPWFTVDLGAQHAVQAVQLWLDASGAAWPAQLSVTVANVPPVTFGGGSTPPKNFQPCFVSAPQSFARTIEGVCPGLGRYVMVQLTGGASRAVTSGGTSSYVLRICALQVYGALVPPGPPNQQVTRLSADQTGLAAGMGFIAAAALYGGLVLLRRRLDARSVGMKAPAGKEQAAARASPRDRPPPRALGPGAWAMADDSAPPQPPSRGQALRAFASP
jgi:hypothetical protein